MKTRDDKKKRIFEKMLSDMYNMANEGMLIDSCMGLDPQVIKAVPLRYRLIAMGFVMRMPLEQVQQKLEQNGCPRLYSRSFREALLIVAFQNGLSYTQWQDLCAHCNGLITPGNNYFQGSKITYADLERYIKENSQPNPGLSTQMYTRTLEGALTNVGTDIEKLRELLKTNAELFSAVREKTRYYFCKYLYYWLNTRVEAYFDICRRGGSTDRALGDLLTLKVVSTLRRNKTMPEADKRKLIRESAVSCGALFEEFNYYFFEYASLSWINILLEAYERIEDIPEHQRHALADELRRSDKSLKRLSDTEAIRKHIENEEHEADEAGAKLNQRGRAGENALKAFIKGTLDIDRTVLVCFLLFFANGTAVPEREKLTTARMNEILVNCGYGALNIEDDFDWFVTEFLESSHPMTLLEDVVVEMARRQENSFLYKLYNGASSMSGDIEALT